MDIFNEITLIYVAHKSDDIIKENINTIKLFKTIIVDNSNSLNLKNYIKDFDNITFVSSPNLGFGNANNLAVSKAQTSFVFIISPDIFFTTESLKILYNKFLSYSNVGVAGPALYNEVKERRTNSSLSFLKKKKFRNSLQRKVFKKLNKNLAEGDISCDYIIGCSMLFKKSFFLEIGGFDNTFFMYYEDNDICDRVRKYNKMVLEIPSSKMIHLQGKSTLSSPKINTLLAITHKISEYKYLNKNISKIKLFFIISINVIDFLQRALINLFFLKFKLSYKNLLRLVSIFLYITGAHKFLRY
jgi:GT2 family glycosyltransferase